MYYEIFLDVLFVKNLIGNYFLLRLLCRFPGASVRRWRSILGACMGASGICLLAVHPCSRMMNTILVYVAINTMMVRFGWKTAGIRQLSVGGSLGILLGILHGGLARWLLRLTQRKSLSAFFLAETVSYLFLAAGISAGIRWKKRVRSRYRVRLWMDGVCKEGTALLDTGNHLMDLGKRPVCIAGMEILDGLLKEETRHRLWHFGEERMGDEAYGKLHPHFLPFASLGCARGLLLVITLDRLEIEGWGIHKVVHRPVIAFSRENSSFSGNYQLILHPNLIDSQEEFI